MATNNTTFSTNGLEIFFQSKRAGFDAQLVSHLVDFIDSTKRTLLCAIYDLRQQDVLGALARVAKAGKKLHIAYQSAEKRTRQALANFKLLSYATGVNPVGSHLMHNKFLVRDGKSVWTGSANFTRGGLELQDNNCLIASSPPLASQYAADFQKLVTPQTFFLPPIAPKSLNIGAVKITPFFTSTAAVEGIEDAVVGALKGAKSIRILAFLISDPGILGALVKFSKPGFDIQGVYDPHGMQDGLGKKKPDPKLYWFLNDKRFVKAPSHAFNPAPNAEQDFMHNKVMIIDKRVIITGSYNFSENAEANDENLVLIESKDVASAYSTYFDALFAKYEKN